VPCDEDATVTELQAENIEYQDTFRVDFGMVNLMRLESLSRGDSHRDHRIDFFRGVSLLVILVDHVELLTHVRWISNYTMHAFGPVDALDIFIFLSGYVFGIAYSKAWGRSDYRACQRKGLHRAGQLYFAQASLYLLIVTTILTFSFEQTIFVRLTRFREAAAEPIDISIHALILVYQPLGLDVLPLYILFLLIMPTLLCWMLQKNSLLPLMLSYGIYATTQLFPTLNLPLYPSGHWGYGWLFNPFSWQFLFSIAMTLAVNRRSQSLKVLKNKWTVVTSTVLVAVVSAIYMQQESNWEYSTEGVLPWTNKTTLGPLRIIYFLCFVHVAAFCLPVTARIWKSKIARPLINCGKHSLSVFCLGVLLTYACAALHELADLSNHQTKFVELGAIGCSLIFAYGLTLTKDRS